MEKVILVSVVNDYARYDRCIRKNPFVLAQDNLQLVDFDNTQSNLPIPKRYNDFIKSYDFNTPAWIIFCHCDWELLSDINQWVARVDPNSVYGPIGVRTLSINGKVQSLFCGSVIERRRDGSDPRRIGHSWNKLPLETLDCMAFAIHSSLIKELNFSFDEHLEWDCYIEDACIRLRKLGKLVWQMGIKSCHWSGYHQVPPSYLRTLKYMNEKYPNELHAGTVSFIGGKEAKIANNFEYAFALLREAWRSALTKGEGF